MNKKIQNRNKSRKINNIWRQYYRNNVINQIQFMLKTQSYTSFGKRKVLKSFWTISHLEQYKHAQVSYSIVQALKPLYTFGKQYCPSHTLRVSQLIYKITNLWKFRLNRSWSREKITGKPTLVSARFAVSWHVFKINPYSR